MIMVHYDESKPIGHGNTLECVKENKKICDDISDSMYWKYKRLSNMLFNMCNHKFLSCTQADHATKNIEFEQNMRLKDKIFNNYMSTFFPRVFSVCVDEDMYSYQT